MQYPNTRTRWFIYAILAISLAALAILTINKPALAQSPHADAKVEIKLKPLETTRLEDQKPVPVTMKLDQVPGGNSALAKDVKVKAFARYVEVSGKKIAQVMVTGIERKDGTTVSLRDQNLIGQFELTRAQLDPSVPIVLEGDQQKLVSALNQLRKATAIAARQEEETQTEEDENSAEEEQSAPQAQTASARPSSPSSGGGTSRGVSGNASSNPTASAFRAPTPTTSTSDDSDDEEPTTVGEIEVSETTEGCSIRIDLAQNTAFQQSRLVTTEDGKETEATECSDGTVRYEIQRSYQMCDDSVDLGASIVTAQFQLFYEDANQSKVLVGSCQADKELLYPIVEKAEGCDPVINEQGEEITAQAALVYKDKNNIETVIRECADSTTNNLAMARDYSVCEVNVDETAGKATDHYQNYYELDGGKVTVGECKADPERIYTIENNFNLCSNQVDEEAGKAYRQTQKYYVNSQQARIDVGECTPVTEGAFDIVESRTGCSTFIDYDAGTATPMVRLIYMDQDNVEHEVRSCDASTALSAITMTQTTETCTIRHDFETGVSHSQSIWTYEDEGQSYQVGDCLDDGTIYSHNTVYKDAFGQDFCGPVVNMVSGKATLQHRISITVNDTATLISECQPDTLSKDILSTTEGCSDPVFWTHDLSAARSYGQERFYYDNDGTPVYVSQCQASNATFDHQTENVGWQNNDSSLSAFEVLDVYITTGDGRYYVQRDHIPNGAVQVPYELKEETTQATGAPFYIGCTRTTQIQRNKIWTRPDTTEYTQNVGTDVSETSEGVCIGISDTPTWTRSAIADTKPDLSSYNFSASIFSPFENNTCDKTYDGTTYSYNGTREVQREDGARITQVNAITRNIYGLGKMELVSSYVTGGPVNVTVEDFHCKTNATAPVNLNPENALEPAYTGSSTAIDVRDISIWNEEGWD